MAKILLVSTIFFLNIVVAFTQNTRKEIRINKNDIQLVDSLKIIEPQGGIENVELKFCKIKIKIEGFPLFNFKPYILNNFDLNSTLAIPFNSNSEDMGSKPSLHNYSRSISNNIINGLSLYSGSCKNEYLNYGEFFRIDGAIQWLPNSRFSFKVGGFFCRQFNFFTSSRSDVIGLNTQTSYALTNKIQFNIYGQYVAPSEQNIFKGNSFFPNSNIGSSFLFKLKNNTNLDMGVKYRYYENKMNWNVESVSKISIGF